MANATITGRVVEAGSRVLDDVMPDWRQHIDKDTFRISDIRFCVLGQLFESFDDGRRALGMDQGMLEAHGFDLHPFYAGCQEHDHWSELQLEWLKELNK